MVLPNIRLVAPTVRGKVSFAVKKRSEKPIYEIDREEGRSVHRRVISPKGKGGYL